MRVIDVIRAHPHTTDDPADVWDEDEDGKWAVLKKGLCRHYRDPVHTCHESTWTGLLRAVREAQPCDCSECQG
jgi:hypothetical protein